VAIAAAEHVLRFELSPLTHQISEYATGPGSAVALTGFVAWAISLAASARLAWCATSSRVLPALLLLAAAGLIAVAVFQTQSVAGSVPRGTRITLTGRLHDAGSGAATLALFCAVLVSAARPELRRIRALAVGLATCALSLNFVLLGMGDQVGGLRQRLLLVVACVWQTALLVAISRMDQSCEHEPPEVKRVTRADIQ